jgi:hypothetical protein
MHICHRKTFSHTHQGGTIRARQIACAAAKNAARLPLYIVLMTVITILNWPFLLRCSMIDLSPLILSKGN